MQNLFSDAYFETKYHKTFSELAEDINEWKEYDLLEQVKLFTADWIQNVLKAYSKDYDFLNQNWQKLCFQWKTETRQILLVSFLPLGADFTNHRLLEGILNKMTKHGFVIRTSNDLFVCGKCHQNALLHQGAHEQIKRRNALILEEHPNTPKHYLIPVPPIWTPLCSDCAED